MKSLAGVLEIICKMIRIFARAKRKRNITFLPVKGDDFYHVDSVYTEPDCASCHTGAL